jgi:hypothetical protein
MIDTNSEIMLQQTQQDSLKQKTVTLSLSKWTVFFYQYSKYRCRD